MSSVNELVEQLKQGVITKEELLTRMRSPDITISSSFTSNARGLHEDPQWSLPISPGETSPLQHTDEDEDLRPLEAPQMSVPTAPPTQNVLRSSVSFSRLSPEQFYAYQTNWKRSREEASEQLKVQLQAAEVKDCTFHPKTNPAADLALSPAFDRLYQVRDPRYYDMVRQEQRAKEESLALRECSFQPSINTRSRSVASKHRDVQKELRINPRTLIDLEKECTFTPKVNPLKRGMKVAKEYVSSDPFERLTRTKPKEAVDTGGSIGISEIQSHGRRGSEVPPDEAVAFSQKPFFERQAIFEIMKSEKRLQLQNQSIESRPTILERSKKMVTDNFEERNRRLLEKKKQHSERWQDTECTFAPAISRKAQERRTRTIEEMSYGDAQKKEMKLAYLKDSLDQQAVSSAVPHMSTCNDSVSSHLQLSTNLSTYLTRIQQDKARKEKAAERIKMERVSREMRECTYAPITKDAPAYIKRIARSVAILKAEMPPAEVPEKPEWR